MMKVVASALLVLFVLNCDPLQSQQTHSVFSQAFLKEAITAIDAIDAAYKSVLNRDPDAVYAPLWEEVQKSLVSLKTEASARREKEFLKLLYSVSNVIGMMRKSDNNSTDDSGAKQGLRCSAPLRPNAKSSTIP